MTAEARKYQLIEQITAIDDIVLLSQLKAVIDNYKPEENSLLRFAKTIEEKIDLEKLKKEQNYTGFDKAEVEKLIEEIDLQEPIDELLESI